jgi:GNAT superfamily N-acetyltransferase
MRVREWDAKASSSDEIESIVATLNEVLAGDLPEDPPWQSTGMRAYLTETMPGERRVYWLIDAAEAIGATDATKTTDASKPTDATKTTERRALGYANLLVLGDIGVVEVLVHPSARGRGVGRSLLATVVRRAYSEGLSSLGVEAVGGTPAGRFWEVFGFRCAYVEMRNILDLSSVDWPKLAETAAVIPAGYRVEYHPGGLPSELLERYAAAKAVRRETEPGDLELRPSSYDAQRLAESLETLNRRGMKPHLVLAIHEETGEVASLTEVVAPTQHPTRADQYDTIVVPAHQDLGLERAIKARMLLELRSAEPRLTEVQTWNALENDPIALVNAELGFRPDREWREYEADVLDLIDQLGH